MGSAAWSDAGVLWVAGTNYFARIDDAGVPTIIDAGNNALYWSIGLFNDEVFLVGRTATCAGGVVRYTPSTGAVRRTCLSPHILTTITGTSLDDIWVADIDGGVWRYSP